MFEFVDYEFTEDKEVLQSLGLPSDFTVSNVVCISMGRIDGKLFRACTFFTKEYVNDVKSIKDIIEEQTKECGLSLLEEQTIP